MHDHESFQRLVLRSTVAAALAGGAIQLVAGWARTGSAGPAPLVVVGIGAALVLARVGWETRLGRALALAAGLGTLASLLAYALYATGHPYLGAALFGAVAGAAGSFLPGGARGLRRAIPVAATALAGTAALFVASGLTRALTDALPGTPAFVAGATFAALGGFFLALGDLGNRVSITRDPVTAAFRATQPLLSGELRGLAERAVRTRQDIGQAIRAAQAELESGPHAEAGGGVGGIPAELGRNVDEVLLRTLALARRCADLEAEVQRTPVSELTDRLERLDQKIEACHDAIAREQYTQAKAALASQLAYRQQIEGGRERVVARLHNDLAELEKVRLALVRARSMDAHAAAEALAPLVERLKSVGEDLDLTSEAMTEAATATPAA